MNSILLIIRARIQTNKFKRYKIFKVFFSEIFKFINLWCICDLSGKKGESPFCILFMQTLIESKTGIDKINEGVKRSVEKWLVISRCEELNIVNEKRAELIPRR